MTRPSALLVIVLALLLPACGDDVATLDTTVAEDLAGRADVLAGQLEAGDACGARATAGGLVTVTSEARDAGTVPEPIAAEVIATTRDLVRDVSCEPEPEPEPAPAPPDDGGGDDAETDGGDRGRGGGPGGNEGKGAGDDKQKDKDDEDRDERDD